jgi:hypothetical protein
MKPHIRRAYVRGVGGWFICLSRLANGFTTHYKAGLGQSPTEAYADWARMNHVNQNS